MLHSEKGLSLQSCLVICHPRASWLETGCLYFNRLLKTKCIFSERVKKKPRLVSYKTRERPAKRTFTSSRKSAKKDKMTHFTTF